MAATAESRAPVPDPPARSRSAWYHAAWGAALAAVLCAAYVAHTWLFGGQLLAADGGLTRGARGALVVNVLLAFLLAVRAYENSADDFANLRRRLGWSDAEFTALVRGERPRSPRTVWLYRGIGALIGIAMIPASGADPEVLLTPGRAAGLVWSLVANAFLFAVMADTLYDNLTSRGADERIAAAIPLDDLLDRSMVEPFARQGLRRAFYWAGGSSIASLLFLELAEVWALVPIIGITCSCATLAFLSPALAIRGRVAERKQSELERVRSAILLTKEHALAGAGTPGAAELPGLLAWEARLGEVREWPYDFDSRLRFGGLLALAVGSWLGGALVERVLAFFWS